MGASEGNDVEKVAARFESEADDLHRHNDEVGRKIETTRQDWERKRSDSSVPGAVPEDPPEDGPPADESPASEAPSEDAGPGAAETPE